MTIKELYEIYGGDFEIKLSVHSCANIFEVSLKDLGEPKVYYRDKKLVFDAEYN